MSARKLNLIIAFLLASGASASTRLTYDINGVAVPVSWPASAFPLRYQVDSRLASSIPAIERAFGEWSGVAGTGLAFQDLGAAPLRAGRDNINAITVADDLFAGQKCLAYTTPTHDDNGNLLEADIQIDASLLNDSNNYNLQQVLAHEIGHLLGLDHSAVLSATMYPYVGPNTVSPLDSDDRLAIASIYPNESVPGATLTGRVTGDRGAVFAAQVVAVNNQGEPVATGLTNQSGDFALKGVPPGDYRIYAEPLDGPVSTGNLAGVWRESRDVSFPTAFATGGTPLHVEDGRIYGNLEISTAGSVRLNPRTVGSTPAGSNSIMLNTMPVTLKPNTTVQICVGGDGFTSGVTTFEVLSPAFHQAGKFTYASDGSYMSAPFRVDANAPGGSATILVHDGRDMAALTGALRIDAPRGARPRAVAR